MLSIVRPHDTAGYILLPNLPPPQNLLLVILHRSHHLISICCPGQHSTLRNSKETKKIPYRFILLRLADDLLDENPCSHIVLCLRALVISASCDALCMMWQCCNAELRLPLRPASVLDFFIEVINDNGFMPMGHNLAQARYHIRHIRNRRLSSFYTSDGSDKAF